MPSSNYEYRDLLASSWDFHRGEDPGFSDTAFYLKRIKQSGQPVLVVGCGTGRLPLAFKQNNVDADGLDVSPEMLNIMKHKVKKKGVDKVIYEQPMEDMDLQRRYKTIIVPSMSFQLVAALKSAKKNTQQFL